MDKYLIHNKLNTWKKVGQGRSQTEKVQLLITQHRAIEETDSEISHESEGEFSAVLVGCSEDEDNDPSDTNDNFQTITTTRSGRIAGTWRNVIFKTYLKNSKYSTNFCLLFTNQ